MDDPQDPHPIRRRVTLRQVAEALGVSPMTVSNAYNHPDQLSPALRERVLLTADRLGYPGPDATARSLRARRAGAIGVLYTDRLSYAFADPAAVLFLQGVSRACERAGLGLLLIPGPLPDAHARDAATLPDEHARSRDDREAATVRAAVVDGFIAYSLPDETPLLRAALARRLPLVLVDEPHLDGIPFVGIDDAGGARAAAEHVVALGHRRVGIITIELDRRRRGGFAGLARQRASTLLIARARLQGYAAGLAAGDVAWPEVPVYECIESLPEQGRRAALALLARNPRPTALLAMSDQLALGALEAARDLGLRVPEDLTLVGFDDVPEAARASPPLTSVWQPHDEKGLRAGELLLARLPWATPGATDAPAPATLLPARLVVRASSGPVPLEGA